MLSTANKLFLATQVHPLEVEKKHKQELVMKDRAIGRYDEVLKQARAQSEHFEGLLSQANERSDALREELRAMQTKLERQEWTLREYMRVTLVLGIGLMELRFWLATQTIKSTWLARIRRYFQEILTPAILDGHEGPSTLLQDWFEQVNSRLLHQDQEVGPDRLISKSAQYFGFFDDILWVAPRVIPGKQSK